MRERNSFLVVYVFMNATINIIVAIGEGNRVIGGKGTLPWHIPEDLRRFKSLTMGHPIIMGKHTFFSIGRPLPGRTNIVLTDTPWEAPEGILIAFSLNDAIEKARRTPGGEEIFIIGGGQVYAQALPIADRLFLTFVHGNFSGDVFFPEYEKMFSKVVSRESREREGYRYEFLTLEK